FLAYMLSPPLAAFVPYNVFIPFYESHAAQISPTLTVERARRGLKHVLLGVAWSVALVGLTRARYWSGDALDNAWLNSVFEFFVLVVKVARIGHLVFGLLILHGCDDRPPLDRPLLSLSYVEMWKRFQIHQKDVQVALFFNPV